MLYNNTAQVQRSFESLYEELCRRIDELVTQWRPPRVVCAPTMSTALPYECSASLGSQQQGPWDMGLLLSLLDAWGLRFIHRDWAFLINSGILSVLQRLMHTLNATLSNANDALSTVDDRTDATGRYDVQCQDAYGMGQSAHRVISVWSITGHPHPPCRACLPQPTEVGRTAEAA